MQGQEPPSCPAARAPAGAGYCVVQSAADYLMCPDNYLDNIVPGAYFAVFAESMVPGTVITQGATVLLKAQATGQFCKVVAVGTEQQIICNVPHASASKFVWDGPALLFQVGRRPELWRGGVAAPRALRWAAADAAAAGAGRQLHSQRRHCSSSRPAWGAGPWRGTSQSPPCGLARAGPENDQPRRRHHPRRDGPGRRGRPRLRHLLLRG